VETLRTKPSVLAAPWKSIYFWLLLGCLLTALLMGLYPYLPEKRLQLVGVGEPELYTDALGKIEWVDKEALRWRCQLDPGPEGLCGFNLYLGPEGENITQFSSVELQLTYEGPARALRYYIRNYEPGLSDIDNVETNKFMQTQIGKQFLDGVLVIRLDEFYVPEWWLLEYDVPRALSAPAFENVTNLGVALPYPAPAGEHRLQLLSAELVGVWVSREGWYGGIITTWLLVLTTAGLVHLVRLRRSVLLERQRRAEVAEQNRQLHSQSEQFRELSRQDQLTGLLNRRGLTEAIEQLFASPDNPLSLLVLDLDHFKSLNDNHGHDVGDQVLRQLGALLSDNTRQTDLAARWGGEEFVLLLPGTGLDGAELIAEKLREKVSTVTLGALPDREVTVSVGVGERQFGEPYHELFKRVDRALYQAKEAGRNRVLVAQTQCQ